MEGKKNLDNLVSLLFNTSRLIRQRISNEANLCHLSMAHFGILHYVAGNGEPTMKEVADYLLITPPSATSLINSLVKSGKLRRLVDGKDRRIIRIAITPQGKKILDDAFKQKSKRMEKVLSNLSNKELRNLESILENLAKHYA